MAAVHQKEARQATPMLTKTRQARRYTDLLLHAPHGEFCLWAIYSFLVSQSLLLLPELHRLSAAAAAAALTAAVASPCCCVPWTSACKQQPVFHLLSLRSSLPFLPLSSVCCYLFLITK